MTASPGRHRYRPSQSLVKIGRVFVGVVGFVASAGYLIDKFGALRGGELLLAGWAIILAVGILVSGPTMMSRPSRKQWIGAGLLVVVAIASATTFTLTKRSATQELMQRWDGHFAKDVDNCDELASVVLPGTQPDVLGPDGVAIARVQLHTFSKPGCPPAVWAWVPWGGDPAQKQPVPDGWTMHVVARRDKTNTRLDATEPASGQPVWYPISKILIANSEAGCVAVDVFLTKNDGTSPPTPTATTGCRTVG
ncbi:hypothetical protein LIX17_26090 (plasmid) [Mycobacterium avium subsp. hominissuis]|uniref:hypothetical protein n=1 Tax=Mycobacterium avium TaxID=1764 RepID=UPI00313FE91C